MLLVGRDEDDMRLSADLARDLEAAQIGHLDIEKHHVGRLLFDDLQGSRPVADDGGDAQLGHRAASDSFNSAASNGSSSAMTAVTATGTGVRS